MATESLYHAYDNAGIIDPHPLYHRMRAENPIYWDPQERLWFFTRYSDVLTLLKDSRGSSYRESRSLALMTETQRESLKGMRRILAEWMLFKDDSDHTRLRSLVAHAFTPSLIEKMRPEIQRLVDELISDFTVRGNFEAVGEFAEVVPLLVIGRILGLPPEDRTKLKRWSDAVSQFVVNTSSTYEMAAESQAGLQAMIDYLEVAIEERRHTPREDLLSRLVEARENGSQLSREELLGTCTLLLFAGHETTSTLIASTLYTLLRFPDELKKLRGDYGLTASCIEEVLRFEGPVHRLGRMARADIEIGGAKVLSGQRMVLMLAAANRDPEYFPDPDVFDISRTGHRHLGFGMGQHFCTGAALARLEAQIAIGSLLRRAPNLKLTVDKVEWQVGKGFRGPASLPLAF